LSVEVYGLGLCVACSCMAGSIAKGIFGNLACWFILDDCFDLFFRVLLLIFLSFGLLMLGWLLSVWCEGVHGRHFCLSCWLMQGLFRSFGFYRHWIGLCGSLWLGGCFEDVSSDRLRSVFGRKLLTIPLFWWHFRGCSLKNTNGGCQCWGFEI
jgi:hypothetical protein